ncbi:LuxR C-terminal-related transcriptional regulator [Brevibacterium album]|uniref:LuxR C-terminal-related transcriptional regulator n=1 Tax=Brevibacterium album TaxID=417948 RepID=UPI00041D2030|nr:LuxR C-terminal-related transcriptional regulator [Brevibacterium album]
MRAGPRSREQGEPHGQDTVEPVPQEAPPALGIAAASARALVAEERAAALVLPGLWGMGGVLAAAAQTHGREPDLVLIGGLGGPGAFADLLTALLAAGVGVETTEQALEAWDRLCAGGAYAVVREAAALDPETASLLTRAVHDSRLRLLVLMRTDEDLCPPLRTLLRGGSLVWARIAPLSAQELAQRLRTGPGVTGQTAVLDRVHDLTAGHPELVDQLLAAAVGTSVLVRVPSGWLWSWDEDALRTALRPVCARLLTHFSGEHGFIVRHTGLAGVLPEAPVEAATSWSTVLDLLNLGVLTWRHDSAPGCSSLQLAPEMLLWAVEDTTSAGEKAAAWYEFGHGITAAHGDRSVQAALAAWRTCAEAEPSTQTAAAHVRTALSLGWYPAAQRLLAGLPGVTEGARTLREVGQGGAPVLGAAADPFALEFEVLRAELAWAHGNEDRALSLVAASSRFLWPDAVTAPAETRGAAANACAAPEHLAVLPAASRAETVLGRRQSGPAYAAALLIAHIGLFHPERALAALTGREPAATGPVDEAQFRLGVARGREAGLTLLADVIALLHAGRKEEAFTQVRRRCLEVGPEESALARLWVGTSLGLGGAHDRGRHVLVELLEELHREQGPPHVAESVRGVLLLITMHVGWDPEVFLTTVHRAHQRHPWQPGLAAAQELVSGTLAMQDDRMLSCVRHARGAVAATAGADPFGLRPTALAMLAAAASYLPQRPEAELGEQARAELRQMGGLRGMPYLRFFAQALALVGGGPPTPEVAEAIVEVARQAHAAGYAAQSQQVLMLAVLGASPTALAAVLSDGWQAHNSRAGMVRMLAAALRACPEPAAASAVFSTVETFLTSRSRFLAHVVLAARWSAETDGGGQPSTQLMRLVLRARAEAEEDPWLLDQFAQELWLSERERTIVRSLRDGERTATVAGRLSLSPRTVERLISQLLRRFRCTDRLDLVRLLESFVPEE